MTTYSLAAASVNPSAFPTTYNVNTSHTKNETSSEAINIGNLTQQGDTITVSDQGQTATSAVSSSFLTQTGDSISLTNSLSNIVDQYTTRFQLYDSQGNVIADNQGTAAQQSAYGQWAAGTLVATSNDTLTAIATPEAGIGTVVAISNVEQQGTSLGVKSELTGGDTSEYYNFSLSGTNIKLAFDAGSSAASTRVQILNGNGQIVADSGGNAFQRANYAAATSGTGLTATSGDYTVKVGYATNADTTQNINYNFQLYSGKNYAVVYSNNVKAQPADYTAAGSVTATTDAQAYSRQAFNKIGATASAAVNIGWLAQNVSNLNVFSQLTSADNVDYYSFTQQDGDNMKFGFDSTQTPDSSNIRVQLYDGSGTRVIADNAGTPAQQAAYKSLTTTNGLTTSPGNYIVKISYLSNATTADTQYDFNIFSGTSYSAQYKTLASPQTYGNALLAGNVGGSATSGMAAYLTNLANGGTSDVISTLAAAILA